MQLKMVPLSMSKPMMDPWLQSMTLASRLKEVIDFTVEVMTAQEGQREDSKRVWLRVRKPSTSILTMKWYVRVMLLRIKIAKETMVQRAKTTQEC
jgi:hypothetical protein